MRKPDLNEVKTAVDAIPQSIVNEIQKTLSDSLDKCGLYYRIFSRRKSGDSAMEKIRRKGYVDSGKKMQDLIGVRIALYFKDDIEFCQKLVGKDFSIDEENTVRDAADRSTFQAERLNLICRMPKDTISHLKSNGIWQYPIDKTFELQIRTIFSEGWHEVEHDLRYKSQNEWTDYPELARQLNSVLATLETCDWAILHVFDTLAYQKYKNGEWASMLRNHLRIRMNDNCLSEEIRGLFDRNPELAKSFFRTERDKLLYQLLEVPGFPKKLDNVVYFMNEFFVHNDEISAITPDVLKEMWGCGITIR